jgi:hypothetical protein
MPVRASAPHRRQSLACAIAFRAQNIARRHTPMLIRIANRRATRPDRAAGGWAYSIIDAGRLMARLSYHRSIDKPHTSGNCHGIHGTSSVHGKSRRWADVAWDPRRRLRTSESSVEPQCIHPSSGAEARGRRKGQECLPHRVNIKRNAAAIRGRQRPERFRRGP